MPRVSDALARHLEESSAYQSGAGDHNRLREIHADYGWKIIPLPAAESRRSGINRGRWCRKSGGLATSGKAEELSRYYRRAHRGHGEDKINSPYLCELHDLCGEFSCPRRLPLASRNALR